MALTIGQSRTRPTSTSRRSRYYEAAWLFRLRAVLRRYRRTLTTPWRASASSSTPRARLSLQEIQELLALRSDTVACWRCRRAKEPDRRLKSSNRDPRSPRHEAYTGAAGPRACAARRPTTTADPGGIGGP